jgi:hypothetical protein
VRILRVISQVQVGKYMMEMEVSMENTIGMTMTTNRIKGLGVLGALMEELTE